MSKGLRMAKKESDEGCLKDSLAMTIQDIFICLRDIQQELSGE